MKAQAVKTKEDKMKNERAVFDKQVQRQGSPIYKVLSMGTCVEFTDKIAAGNAAYKEASKPREMWKIDGRYTELLRKEML